MIIQSALSSEGGTSPVTPVLSALHSDKSWTALNWEHIVLSARDLYYDLMLHSNVVASSSSHI